MDGAADGAKKEQTFGETTVSSLYDIYSSFSLCNLLVLYFYSDWYNLDGNNGSSACMFVCNFCIVWNVWMQINNVKKNKGLSFDVHMLNYYYFFN